MNTSETMKHARAAVGKSAAEVALDATVERVGNALAGHTPGPYHANAIHKGRIVGDETAKSPIEHIEICNHNATVARVYRPRDVPLFRAAPDLLKALRLLVKSYAEQDGEEGGAVYFRDDIAIARAAIARAEGGGK